MGGYDGDLAVGSAEGLDLGLGEVACAYDEARAAGEFQKDWEQVHSLLGLLVAVRPGISGGFWRVPHLPVMRKVFKLNTLGLDHRSKVLHLHSLEAKYSIQTGYCRILRCPVLASFL